MNCDFASLTADKKSVKTTYKRPQQRLKIGCSDPQAPMGFEPMTSCLLDRRSNQLSYGAMCIAMRFDEKIYKSLLTGPTQNDMPLSLDCFCVTLKAGS